ncbi:shell matrix protein-like [Mizuhopecten yessoensis]|uniref:Shell matrix protein n=1 Tax=Mizuhopecten yessoensis TaxID=6573 RepID=A0A210Q887_MIZYE|nr:shell matrix protein-like [Mizuhopecten yessoensis]OWF44925.1 Shell matrix protein [Mizuhopecten yessoensis]
MAIFGLKQSTLLWICITLLVVVSAQFNLFNPQRPPRDSDNFQITTEKPCELLPNPSNRKVFLMNVNGEWTDRPCAFGTLYNQQTCDCSDHDPDVNLNGRRCRAPLYIPFNGEPIRDEGGTNIALGNNGRVRAVTNVGSFDGNGALTIWMYAGIYFGEHLGITFRFRDVQNTENIEQVLVSNCFYNDRGSVEIVIQPRLNKVVFRGTTDNPFTQEIHIPYQPQSWNTVTYSYDGVTLTGNVNNKVVSRPLTGPLTVSPGSLRLGMCNGRGYVGDIDEFRLCQPILATLNQS